MLVCMLAYLVCFNAECRTRYPITEVLYSCPKCGGLLEAGYDGDFGEPETLKRIWRDRRTSNHPVDQSGVWRYRELFPFLNSAEHIVTLREGNTPLLPGARAAAYAGLKAITFKHQGFNPTGSFKDNGMTCGVAQAVRLGKKRVACVSTGNTSASMAAYAAAAGLDPIIFIPNGNIAFGKLGKRSIMARALCKWTRISTRFWRWFGRWPNGWGLSIEFGESVPH